MESKHNLQLKVVFFPSYEAEYEIETRLEVHSEIPVLKLLTLHTYIAATEKVRMFALCMQHMYSSKSEDTSNKIRLFEFVIKHFSAEYALET